MLRGRTAEAPLFEPVALPGHVPYTKILVLHQEPKMKMLLKMVEEEGFHLVVWAKPSGPARVMKSKTNTIHLVPGSATIRHVNAMESAPKSMSVIELECERIRVRKIAYKKARKVHLGEVRIRDELAKLTDSLADEKAQLAWLERLLRGKI